MQKGSVLPVILIFWQEPNKHDFYVNFIHLKILVTKFKSIVLAKDIYTYMKGQFTTFHRS